MKPHVHAELIKQWADGAEIEYYSTIDNCWWFCASPDWTPNTRYRIKGKDIVVFCDVSPTQISLMLNAQLARPNLKLTFDCNTNKLITAEVLF